MRALIFISVAALLGGCSSKGGGAASTKSSPSSPAAVVRTAQLTWAASTGSPTGYSVEQSTDGVTYTPVTTTAATFVAVGGLTSGHTYYFRVKAYNSGGYSTASNVITLSP